MREDIKSLINIIESEDNPSIIAIRISCFVSDALKKGEISLYEAYMITREENRFKRMGYTQSAWNDSVNISTCLDLLNLKLLSTIFEDYESSRIIKNWAIEAYNLNEEKRKHYIMDRYMEFIEADEHPELLKELLEIRYNYKNLSFNNGPYHNEAFPYDFYSTEKILLEGKDSSVYKKELKEDIEDLIVELNMK